MDVSIKNIPRSFFLSVPLILGSFLTGVFFQGTDNILVFPHIAAMLAFAGLALWPCFKEGWAWPRAEVLVASLLFYWGYIWLSILWSTNPYNSTFFALIFSVLPFMFFTLVLTPDRKRWLYVHMGALAAGIAVLAVWALIQFFFIEYGKRVHHPMLNPNNLSIVFNMALFPALALYFCAQRKAYTYIGAALSFLFLFALYVTLSRAGVLTFILASIPLLLLVKGQAGFSVKKLLAFLAVAVGLFSVVHFVSAGFLGNNFVRTMMFPVTGEKSVLERTIIWASTWGLIQEHFWTGTGLGTFYYFYPRHRAAADGSDGYFAHMDPLQFWAEMGVFAPVLFYAVLITVLLRTIQVLRASDPGSPERAKITGCFCGLFALAGHAHVSFHLYMPVILFLAAFLLAGWYVAGEEALKERRKVLSSNNFALNNVLRVIFIVVLLTPVVWMGRAAAGVHYLNQVPVLMQAGEREEARSFLKKAKAVAPKNYSPFYDYQAREALERLRDRKTQRSEEERRALYNQAHEYVDKAILFNRGFTNLWNLKALIYFAGYPAIDAKGLDEAQALLEKAIEANPLLADARFGLSHLHRAKGDLRKAHDILEDALKYPIHRSPSSLNLYNQLAILKLELKDVEGYNFMIEKRNLFVQRYGIEIKDEFPVSPEEMERILGKK